MFLSFRQLYELLLGFTIKTVALTVPIRIRILENHFSRNKIPTKAFKLIMVSDASKGGNLHENEFQKMRIPNQETCF